ncbi:uncharacterized protein A4U43_C02F17980 [Asparagus officinalis]|uniref:Uncharacterized protein n=1 Tax=Asparagus officinalis TaxID=4686 RepID=A0A5P1FLS8_ASPOF|nr:uncharacterized protein A4U43_C02F17980 [Asparagus officinalis]
MKTNLIQGRGFGFCGARRREGVSAARRREGVGSAELDGERAWVLGLTARREERALGVGGGSGGRRIRLGRERRGRGFWARRREGRRGLWGSEEALGVGGFVWGERGLWGRNEQGLGI